MALAAHDLMQMAAEGRYLCVRVSLSLAPSSAHVPCTSSTEATSSICAAVVSALVVWCHSADGFTVSVTSFEIYGGRCSDLLHNRNVVSSPRAPIALETCIGTKSMGSGSCAACGGGAAVAGGGHDQVNIREDGSGRVVAMGLKEDVVETMADMMALIERGNRCERRSRNRRRRRRRGVSVCLVCLSLRHIVSY